MEFLAVFIVTLLVLVILVLGLHFGKAPTYRPERDSVIQLIRTASEGAVRSETWALFLGVPIHHDPLLEKARQACICIDDTAKEGLNGAVYDKEGRQQLAELLNRLLQEVEKQPVTQSF